MNARYGGEAKTPSPGAIDRLLSETGQKRARALGLQADPDFHAVLRQYAQDHPDAVKPPAARPRPTPAR